MGIILKAKLIKIKKIWKVEILNITNEYLQLI